ncbi:MAG: LacI family DNA-binding transcriptional regulator [Pseudomonadota bacterium]
MEQPQKIRTMEEFASVSGISRPTLSKYFNDPKSVRVKTRERIEAALDKFDYTPNFYAINQNRQLTRNVGIVVPYLADPFFAEVARNLELLCAQSGFNPILLSSHGDPKREIENLESLKSIKPAGVLLAPLGRRSHTEAVHGFCRDIPTVLFDCDIEGSGDAFFGSNNTQSIGMIVEYLCRTGEPPAFFEMGDAPNPNANKRRVAYEQAMRNQGHDPMFLVAEGNSWEFEAIGMSEGGRMIQNRLLPTNTVLCSNDRLAIGFLAAAYEAGLRVGIGRGHALRVAGHDDHPYAAFTCPSLTTVSQDYDAIAGHSLDRLLGIIEAGERPSYREAQMFDGRLVMRKSA